MTMTMTQQLQTVPQVSDHEARLLACDLVRTRFPGRAAMRVAADTSPGTAPRLAQSCALVRLERRLGLAVASELTALAAVERAAVRRYATADRDPAARDLAPEACAEIDALRVARLAPRGDKIGARLPGHAQRVIVRRRAKALLRAASFRSATHAHTSRVLAVELGEEGAVSVSDSMPSAAAGMGAAYCSAAYRVATSSHTWSVSAALLSSEVRILQAEAPRGVVYLRVDLRVRQGRGTSLVVERRAGARGGWEVRS